MKRVKHTYLGLLVKTLAMLGVVALGRCSYTDYGCRVAEYQLKGSLKSSETNEPLNGIYIQEQYHSGGGKDTPASTYSYSAISDEDGRFNISLYGGSCSEEGFSKSDLYRVYFYDPDSTYQTTDTVLGIVAEDGYGERDIIIYMKKRAK